MEWYYLGDMSNMYYSSQYCLRGTVYVLWNWYRRLQRGGGKLEEVAGSSMIGPTMIGPVVHAIKTATPHTNINININSYQPLDDDNPPLQP
jgi:hypothetical protein